MSPGWALPELASNSRNSPADGWVCSFLLLREAAENSNLWILVLYPEQTLNSASKQVFAAHSCKTLTITDSCSPESHCYTQGWPKDFRESGRNDVLEYIPNLATQFYVTTVCGILCLPSFLLQKWSPVTFSFQS